MGEWGAETRFPVDSRMYYYHILAYIFLYINDCIIVLMLLKDQEFS